MAQEPNGALDAVPVRMEADLAAFNDDGVLPPGDYAPNRVSFESRFVNTGNVSVRNEIYNGWNLHRLRLLQAGLAASARQLLDGSYITAKAAPGDMDLAVVVPLAGTTVAHLQAVLSIRELLRGPEMKSLYKCDAYPIFSLPRDHADYESVTAEAFRYWTKWFGRTRAGAPKGRVWAATGGLR